MLDRESMWTWDEIREFGQRAAQDFYDIDLCEYNGGHYFEEIKPGLFKCDGCPMIERRY